MKYLPYYVIFFLGFYLLACQNTSNTKQQQQLSVEYYIRYLQPENTLRAEATFYKGDSSSRRKIAVEKVSFQNQAMDIRSLKQYGIRYRLESNNSYPQNFDFKFVDQNGKSHEHQSQMEPLLQFEVQEPLRKSAPITLQWDGAPLRKYESIVFLFSDQHKLVVSHQHDGPTAEAEITLPPNQLDKLSAGEGQLHLVKKRLINNPDQEVFAQTLIEYYTKPLQITLID